MVAGTRNRKLRSEDMDALRCAFQALERPSFAARVSAVLGTPVRAAFELLPPGINQGIQGAAEAAIARALEVAIGSLRDDPPHVLHERLHRSLAIVTGAIGGFFGLPAVLLELPFTTVIMLRSIADVAHSYGEDLDSLDTRLACMEVFAVGGRTPGDDNFEIGYYEVRAALGFHFSTLAAVDGALTREHVPGALRLVRAIAGRFGVVVSDKLAVQLVPVVGAVSGAMINDVFIRYFHDLARGHFAIRDLERRYGVEAVQAAYRAIALEAERTERAAAKSARPVGGVVLTAPEVVRDA